MSPLLIGEPNPLKPYYRDAEKCRVDCVARVPAGSKSKLSPFGAGTKRLGALDCIVDKQRPLNSIKYVALHEGKIGAISWWWLKHIGQGKRIGTHYFIDRNGKVEQVVDERFVVWHGVKNNESIGIDLDAGCSSANGSAAASRSCNYTQAQYDSLKSLIKSIESRTSVVFDDEHILGHCQSKNTTHVDPRNFDWTKIGLDNNKHKGKNCKYAL
jgi:hypothetical protein